MKDGPACSIPKLTLVAICWADAVYGLGGGCVFIVDEQSMVLHMNILSTTYFMLYSCWNILCE